MSPRRRVVRGERDFFVVAMDSTRVPLRWGLPVTSILATLVAAAAIAAAVVVLVGHERTHRTEVRDAAALGSVRSFMSNYTSLDPFHANDYADRVLAGGTGKFAKSYRERLNEIVVKVAQAEPTTGNVVAAGVQRWNDDGSADVLVATTMNQVGPDGKTPIQSGNRWVVTATEEGQQWKISNLIELF